MNPNERTFRRTVGAIGGTMLIFLLCINLLRVVLVLLDAILIEFEVPVLWGNLIFYAVYAAGYLASFMLPVAFMKLFIRKKGLDWAPMQTSWRISAWWLLAVPAGIAIIFSASYLNAIFVSVFGLFGTGSGSMEELAQVLTSRAMPYEWVIQFIVICLVPGFCEEFLFRGAILTNLLPFGRSNAILMSALLFSLMHQNPSQFFYAFVAGIVLGVLYERTGSIWPGTVLHICNNFASVGESILPYGLANDFRAMLAGAVMELVIAFLGVISIAILILRYFSKPRDFRGGVFGSTEGSVCVASAYPIEKGRWVKLFLSPTMVIFLVLCILEVIPLMLGGY